MKMSAQDAAEYTRSNPLDPVCSAQVFTAPAGGLVEGGVSIESLMQERYGDATVTVDEEDDNSSLDQHTNHMQGPLPNHANLVPALTNQSAGLPMPSPLQLVYLQPTPHGVNIIPVQAAGYPAFTSYSPLGFPAHPHHPVVVHTTQLSTILNLSTAQVHTLPIPTHYTPPTLPLPTIHNQFQCQMLSPITLVLWYPESPTDHNRSSSDPGKTPTVLTVVGLPGLLAVLTRIVEELQTITPSQGHIKNRSDKTWYPLVRQTSQLSAQSCTN
eukprot:GFUD01043527.1.p1 GENE.GFUD01043527.1~~GFUD01043527.1.p1  ORF type:complete len:270 (+),score=50.34 GFUD01043527.1:109-918(+)